MSLPLIEDAESHPHVEVKPSWRGWIHTGTFPLAIAAGVVLIVLADGPAAKWSSAVFMTTSLLLFGIFLLIAGTYTPLAVLALPPSKGVLLLVMVWSGALLGIFFRVFWVHAPRWLYVALYILLGWAAMMYVVDLFQANIAMMVLVIVGGLAYTAGAVIYGMKKPNPIPGVFGFHEIFHTLTVIAFVCHWTAILLIAMHPAYNA